MFTAGNNATGAMDFITLLPPSFEGVANVADIPDYVHEA
jgi:hypothetical protein